MVSKGTAVVAGILVAVLALLLAGWGGYAYRDARCGEAEARMREEAADALALLARRYAEADAKASGKRATRRQVVTQRVTGNSDAAKALPDRGCGFTADERRLLDDTYCTAFPSASGCVPGGVRNPAQGSADQ